MKIQFNFLSILLTIVLIGIIYLDYMWYLDPEKDELLFGLAQFFWCVPISIIFDYINKKTNGFENLRDELTKKRTIQFKKFFILILFSSFLISCDCGCNTNEKVVKDAKTHIKKARFKKGDIVYIKPDSSKVIIKEVFDENLENIHYNIYFKNNKNELEEDVYVYEYLFY